MPDNTPNLNLIKPLSTDNYNVADQNANMDIIDQEVGDIKDNKVDKVLGKDLSSNDYTDIEKLKLSGIEESANNYAHPLTHPPSIINQDEFNRFVTDVEKTTWNGKANQSSVDALDVQMADLVSDVTGLVQINKDIVILSAGWVDDTGTSGYWYYQITDATVDVNTVVDVYFSKDDLEGTAKTAKVSGGVDSFAGYYRLYAKLQPASGMTVDVKIIKEVF